ncbi:MULTISPECIES: hypothetical protein [unclassified Roseofilum]|uniref:hypothetical protein n=1 Tax=unclassified Roseofilum TaxID=2620099 RepID=UPI000E8E213A|nr:MULTISPECIES: hypothetical protein [unclassified Roseofilum]MBP0010806.1 hypothetical protein [Roseofilum sp. Belize Diploria]MBP0034001.1 hypothetical protein [Roseofilum sp. Belize BBD 4]HBQ99126.1 hypothetical protein [Cyanobacteria bacterium UBA11691]
MDTHNQNSPNTTNKIAKLGAKISTTLKLVTNDPITSILCVFQGISWSTTVQGAHIIFPETAPITLVGTSLSFKLIPLVLGSAVQLALILLLIARAKSQSTIHTDKLFNIDRNDDSDTNKKPLFYKLLLTKMECSPFNWLEDYQQKEAANLMGLGNLLGSNKMQNQSNSPSVNPSQPNPPKSKKLRFKKECKDAFLNWLTSEIENQINQEQVESKTVTEISLYANPTLRLLSSPEET